MNDKIILIIGATSMIGAACARIFAQQGAKLMLVGRDLAKLSHLATQLSGTVEFCVTDVSQADEIKSMIHKTLKLFNHIDTVIINSAIYPWKKIADLDLSEWNDTITVNLTAPFLIAQACFNNMKQQNGGNIIFISSIAGEIIGVPYMAAYASSKAAINGFMRTAAIEFAPFNIRVNSISPGKMYDESTMTESEREAKLAAIPLQKFTQADDIANMALFLVSQPEKNITGQNFIIDGGQSILGENAHLQKCT